MLERRRAGPARFAEGLLHLLQRADQHEVGDVARLRRLLRHRLKRLPRHQAQQPVLIGIGVSFAAGPGPEGLFNSSAAVSFSVISTPAS